MVITLNLGVCYRHRLIAVTEWCSAERKVKTGDKGPIHELAIIRDNELICSRRISLFFNDYFFCCDRLKKSKSFYGFLVYPLRLNVEEILAEKTKQKLLQQNVTSENPLKSNVIFKNQISS